MAEVMKSILHLEKLSTKRHRDKDTANFKFVWLMIKCYLMPKDMTYQICSNFSSKISANIAKWEPTKYIF